VSNSKVNVTFIPRGKYVLLEQIKNKLVRGLAIPDISSTGVRWIVRGVGAKVSDLSVGDEVMMLPRAVAIQPDEAPEYVVVKRGFIIATIVRTTVDNDYSA